MEKYILEMNHSETTLKPMLGKFIAIAGEMRRFPASNENTVKNNRFLLDSYFSLFFLWASMLLFLNTPGLVALWNLSRSDVAMHVCYGTDAFGSHLPSERRIGKGTNLRKKKTSHLFSIGHLGWYWCCFYRTFTIFIGKTDKIDSFQELCVYHSRSWLFV